MKKATIFKSKVKRQKAKHQKVVSGQWPVAGILLGVLFFLFTVHCTLTTVQAQTGGIFSIMQSTIAGGGGQNVTGEIFSLDYTLGQAVAGDMASGAPYDITHGFWPDSAPASTPSVAIMGTVTYGNAVSGPPPPRFVSNVLISGAGSPAVSALTAFPGGNYSLTGFGSGAYAVTPSKTGGVNSITSFDAAKIAQHVAGISSLTATQLIAADVSNNGTVSSFDAGQIARYVTSSPPFGITGTWKFTPANRNYATVNVNITGEDYTALLMGEVSGNWTNTAARPVGSGGISPEKSTVAAPHLVTPTDNEFVIPVSVEGIANKGIISYEFDLRYDPRVIRPQADPVYLGGTISERLSVVANAEKAGILRVAVYGPMPIESDGVLINLRFKAVGAPDSVSPLIWERIIFNEGDPEAIATDGQIAISDAKL